MRRFAFITGTARSGTTLTEKMAHAFEGAFVASQPYFGFYTGIKKLFFSENPDLATPLPMYHNFPQHADYAPRWRDFLATRYLSPDEAKALTSSAVSAKGQATPAIEGRQVVTSGGSIFDTWRALHQRLTLLHPEPAAVVGSKDIFCEEFVPFLAENGVRCILIVRDPRAVYASISGGNYAEQTGDRYPLLLTLRNWRKTAAFHLALRNQQNILTVRYEDIVGEPVSFTRQLAIFLEVPPQQDIDPKNLRDQYGQPWKGNSSFSDKRGVECSSLDAWRNRIGEPSLQVIEALAEPEMRALGYPLSGNVTGELESKMEALSEPPGQVRAAYLENDGMTRANVEMEIQRLAILNSRDVIGSEKQREWFHFNRAYIALRSAMQEVAQ